MVMKLHVATSCALWLFICCSGSGVCSDAEPGCLPENPEDASLLQLRPDVSGGAISGRRTAVGGAEVVSQWHGSPKCPEDDQPAVLGELDGKDLKLKWATYTPLDVPAGSSLTLLLCNIENRQTSPPVGPFKKDPLVRSVGARAHVYVLVANSFNVRGTGDVFVGPQNMSAFDIEYIKNATRDQKQALNQRRKYWERLDGQCRPSRRRRALIQEEEGGVEDGATPTPEEPEEDEVEAGTNQSLEDAENEREQKKAKQEEGKHKKKEARQLALAEGQGTQEAASALPVPMHFQVPPVVAGPVGKGAIIQVTVKDSANVEGSNVALHEATLVGPAVQPNAGGGLDRSIVQVGVFNSGNVLAKGGSVSMAKSFLLRPTVGAVSFTSADINVHLEASGKVEAKDFTLAGVTDYGAVVGILADAYQTTIKDCKFSITLVETANFDGEELNFVLFPSRDQPRFLDPFMYFDDAELVGANIDVLVSSSGNVRLPGGDVLGNGFLMEPVLDECNLRSSSMRFTVLNSMNLEAGAWYVTIPTVSFGFQKFWSDELVDLDGATQLDFKGVVANSANLKVQQLEVEGERGANSRSAIGEVIYFGSDIDNSRKNNLEVTVEDSVNWEGKLLIAIEALFSLMENAIDINADYFVDSHVSLSISRSGNAHAKGGAVCLADELLDEPIEGDNFNHSTIVAVVSDAASVIASRFEMKLEDLVDEVVDVDNLFDTQVTVKVTSVGNVEAKDVVLYDSAELVETFADGDLLLEGSTMVLGITNCGNVKAKQLTMREDSYLLQDVMEGTFITPVPVTITIASSGNFQGPGSAEISRDSRLIRHVIDPQDDTWGDVQRKKLREFGQTSITLTESASLETQKATLSRRSFLLGVVVDEVEGSRKDFTDLSLLKSLSMFATAVGNDQTQFERRSAPCEQDDLPGFALPFAYSCVPLP